MGKEQQRLQFSRATVARHQVALARSGLEHLHILRVEPRLQQPRLHGPRRRRIVAVWMNRADFDELLVNVESKPLMRGKVRGRPRGCEKKERKQKYRAIHRTHPS